ncbi:MAG: co-chaperone DjlA [Gammaproteobacteria bacterium]|nr:co-chaperone DjlA [Gammaproteobacteria bacterium]
MNKFVFIGALIGYMVARFDGLILGAVIGYAVGRMMDSSVIHSAVGAFQSRFVESTFAVMGAVCKADGRVTAEEIRAAERMFDRLRLTAQARESAKRAFNRGKSPGFDLDAEVAGFARSVRGNPVLLQMFLQVQLSAMAADGALHPAEREMLMRIARGLGLSTADVQRLEALLRGGFAGGRGAPTAGPALDDAYQVLGVSPSASDTELKRAYRRLMSQHHPDKLAGKDLPESMREMAEQKTREITAAYQLIEQVRAQARA